MQNKENLPQAHGRTQAEMTDLQVKQTQNEVTKIPANLDGTIEIAEHNQHMVHVKQEIVQYNSTTGKKISTPFVAQYTPKMFKHMEATGGFNGYKTKVVHDPSKGTVSAISNAAASTPTGVEKPISRMNKAELQHKYEMLYGNEAPENYGNHELKTAIEERMEFLEKEKLENEDKGAGTEQIDAF